MIHYGPFCRQMLEEKLAALLLRFASFRICFSPQRLPVRFLYGLILGFPIRGDIGDHALSHGELLLPESHVITRILSLW